MRPLLAAAAGALVAAIGALILGEYELVGPGALLASAAFGFVVAEAMGAVDRTPPPWLAAVAAAVAAAGWWWARSIQWRVTIDQGRAVPVEVTAGLLVSAVVAGAALMRRRRPSSPTPG